MSDLDDLRRRAAQRQRYAEAVALLRELVLPDDCVTDHDGACQAHGLDRDCPHARAKAFLAAIDLNQEDQ